MNTANATTYNLKIKTLLGFAELIFIIVLFLFALAGSFNFWQAWIYSIICWVISSNYFLLMEK
ncbi:hypothetical protein [Methanosarcina sp. UBA5]|uniref:hypothetical protein n=1 Tax=Methanosarcina sp. UBA5 TaxID=1915593 RepID=UPI0025FE194E|nr:hypothetical protein [Methanosarcina sp. UBA5]